MLVRAWNLHLGKTPDGKGGHLREMVELATADRPAFVCLQEVPAWALDSVGEWAGMKAVTARTIAPKFGPIRVPAGLGKPLGSPGKGNAILLPKDVTIRQEKQITLNTNPFCEEQAGKLGLTPKQAHWWERERRVCHIVKVEFPNRQRMLIANLHATSADDRRLADAELRRAASFVDRQAEIEETIVIAGDFNVTLEESSVLKDLTTRPDERYSAAGPGASHILVRGRLVRRTLPAPMSWWQNEQRTVGGKLLSDHYPVELVVPDPPPPQPAAPPAEVEAPRLPTLAEAQRAAPLPQPEPAAPPPVETPPAPVEPQPVESPPPAVEPGVTPVEPQPAPVEPTPTPVEPSPTPVEPSPTPVEPKTE
jgi:endonuclease/exonuclease/phosphatase family metal-dependent hydrolase